MALGGWKSPAMLSRYVHLSPTHLWSEVEGLTAFKGQNSDGTVTGQKEGEREETQPIENTGDPRAVRIDDPRPHREMEVIIATRFLFR
ncbi:MAG: hypothetical protein QNL45_06960 [Nitrospirota bacterium]|nr:hypothetical protein [Nitrospirota bacterium]